MLVLLVHLNVMLHGLWPVQTGFHTVRFVHFHCFVCPALLVSTCMASEVEVCVSSVFRPPFKSLDLLLLMLLIKYHHPTLDTLIKLASC